MCGFHDFMDIELVNLVIAVAVLAVTVEFSSDKLNRSANRCKRLITDWETSILRALSALADANKKYYTITDADEKKEADLINAQWQYVNNIKKDFSKYNTELVDYIKLFLSILITIEVGHIALQYFQWSFYEGIKPGFNKIYLLFLIGLVLIFFWYIVFFTHFVNSVTKGKFGDKTISEYMDHNSRVITKYKFGMR